MTDLPLGCVARDSVTGLTGILTAKYEMMDGNIQYSVQPYSEEGKEIKEAKIIDGHTLVVQETVGVPPVTPDPDDIEIGDEVQDKLVPANKGTVIERTTFLNGCIYYTAVLSSWQNTPKDAINPSLFLSAKRWKKLTPVAKREIPKENQIEKTGKGGPMRDAPSIR